MSFDKSPQQLIKGWKQEGTSYSVPVSFLPELAKNDANPDTGDSRAIVYAFVESFYQWFNSIPQDKRPSKLQINRSSYVDDSTNTVSRSYTIAVETVPMALSVAKEHTTPSNEIQN